VREQKIKGGGGPRIDEGGAKRRRRAAASLDRRREQKQLTLFTRQLSTLQDAGLPLLRSSRSWRSSRSRACSRTMLGVARTWSGRPTLSDAMAKHPKAFDRLYCKMVNAGEIGGVLDIILQRLAAFMEKAQRLRRRIKGAMIYPVVVILISVAIVSGIMVFVIPKFQEIFNDFGVELPGLTLWLIDASNGGWRDGQSQSADPGGGVGDRLSPIVIFIVLKLIRKTGPGPRHHRQHPHARIPVIGNLIRKTSVARFTRTLGTLISAGVPILEAIMITRDTSGNYVYEKALTQVHDSIREGETFAGPLREAKVVDAIVVNMIDVGEETGDLDAMLMKIADNYDEEVDVAVSVLV
jgi:type IV pilus assembly protein PilC